MQNIPTTEQISVNDVVVTAGLEVGEGTHPPFPRGLLIGNVVGVQTDPSAVVQTALIQPAADLDSLERVLVVTNFEPPPSPRPSASPRR
jgi:cell shape-determining protein MreC